MLQIFELLTMQFVLVMLPMVQGYALPAHPAPLDIGWCWNVYNSGPLPHVQYSDNKINSVKVRDPTATDNRELISA